VTLMKETLSSSETSVLTWATRRNIQEDTIHDRSLWLLREEIKREWRKNVACENYRNLHNVFPLSHHQGQRDTHWERKKECLKATDHFHWHRLGDGDNINFVVK
jgi:hypothetical protein